ncbi:hypothetical protein SLE2022_248530 [Rubroshorea leprosula]
MGKYMKKSKITGDIAVMEVPQSTLGVRTRAAKTLALQRIQKTSPSPQVVSNPDASSLCYLQLRSRRLEKQPSGVSCETSKKQGQKEGCRVDSRNSEQKAKTRVGSRLRMVSVGTETDGSVSVPTSVEVEVGEGCCDKNRGREEFCCETEEASFGENNLDFEGRDRSTRESTPCSLIRNSDTIATPGSTTRRSSSSTAYRGGGNDVQRFIPTANEMEEFFAYAEQQQQRQFIEKYNFDIVNDLPLPGCYEWVQVIP